MDVKIRVGKTRIVVIAGFYALKIIRFRLLDFTCKFIKLHYEKVAIGNELAYKNLHRDSRKQLFKDMLLACFIANYREYELWNSCPSKEKLRYVPTLFTLFYIINVQERANTTYDTDKLLASAHTRKCGQLTGIDELKQPDNLSESGKILDYGSINTTT